MGIQAACPIRTGTAFTPLLQGDDHDWTLQTEPAFALTLRQDKADCVHHVWRSLRGSGVARSGHILVAMLQQPDASSPVRFNVCDTQPLDELLPMDERGAPLPGSGVVLRLLAEGE